VTIRRLLLVLLLAAPAVAQEQPKPTPKQEEKVQVNFMGMDLDLVAQQVERVTKKSFLFQDQLLRGKKVTLKSETPIGPDELYRVFQTICHMNGLVLVPVKGEKIDLVKIVQTQQAQKEPGAQLIVTRGEPLPAGDTLVYYLLTPKNIPSTRAMSVLSSAISSTGVLQQVAGTDLILIIDVATAIARAERLLSLVDVPGETIVNVSMTLKFLSVSQARAQLTDHLAALEKATTGESGKGRLITLSDERLNTLDLYGPEFEVIKAQEYLKRVDRELPPARRTIQYYKLKNVPVVEVADQVRQLLGIALAARQGEEARVTPQAPSPLAGKPGAELAGKPVPPTPAATPPGQPQQQLESQKSPTAPPKSAARMPAQPTTSPLLQDIEVVALEGLNTLVVVGNQSVHEEVKHILENLDKRKGQVLIEVAIIQVTGDDSLNFGVEGLREKIHKDGKVFSGGTGFGLGTQTDTNTTGFPDAQTLSSFTGAAFRYLNPGEISVLFSALATNSNVNILSQPHLVVRDNEDADFTTKVSEPTVAVSQGTVGNVTSFAGFAEAVTSLKIVPHISTDGYLNLKITQNFEEFTGSSGASGVPPPKVSNSVTTNITVPDRYTAILGGFTRDAATESKSGIPILRDIPLIGALAGSSSTKVTRSRLYLFVRPRILATDGFADLKESSKEKVLDLRYFTSGSPIEGAVRKAFAPYSGPEIKEAPLPFGGEKK
jgi:general secretion pathway protein D